MTISPITDFSRFKTAIFMNNQSLEGLKSVSILLERKKNPGKTACWRCKSYFREKYILQERERNVSTDCMIDWFVAQIIPDFFLPTSFPVTWIFVALHDHVALQRWRLSNAPSVDKYTRCTFRILNSFWYKITLLLTTYSESVFPQRSDGCLNF